MKLRVRHSSAIVALFAAFSASACHKADSVAHPQSGPATSATSAMPVESSADINVQKAVTAELNKDKRIDQSALAVHVKTGIVSLSGKVDNAFSKERATRVAEAVRGVRAVDNRMTVVPEKRPDSDIERDVGKALAYDAATSKMPIHTQVKAGVVTLTGTVQSWQEERLAERIVDAVRGVQSTQNELVAKPPKTRPDDAIANDVKSRLAWDVFVEHDPIAVAVKSARVELSGTVGSAAEKRRAERDAWVDGVALVSAGGLLVNVASPPDKNLRHMMPKSDDSIASAIKRAQLYDPRINGFNINPSVKDGVATLSGTVDTLNAKMTAEELARDTVGVTAVKDELVARSRQSGSDRVLENRLKDALVFDPLADSHNIFVSVKNGQAHLTGTVGTFFEKAEAFDVASRIAGITGVDDGIQVSDQAVPYVYSAFIDPYVPYVENWYVIAVRPSGTDTEIQNRIKSEIAWSPFVELSDVHVAVANGKAKLTGTVSSQLERTAAANCALEAGAVSIDNELKVS